jgi:hypothetical protein
MPGMRHYGNIPQALQRPVARTRHISHVPPQCDEWIVGAEGQ